MNVKTYAMDVKDESKGIMQRYGLGGMLGVIRRMLTLYFKNPTYRKFVKEVQKTGIMPVNLNEYFGYGIYIGQK
jgi:hypothetical protein